MATQTKVDRVIGVFDRKADAAAAITDLLAAGFAQDRVEMISRQEGRDEAWPHARQESQAAGGVAKGAAVGAGTGVVAGAVAASLIPGVGPLVAGGLVAGAAALGAAGGAFVGPFLALEMSESAARHYSREVEEGRTVLIVKTSDRQDEARILLDRHGARADSSTEL